MVVYLCSYARGAAALILPFTFTYFCHFQFFLSRVQFVRLETGVRHALRFVKYH